MTKKGNAKPTSHIYFSQRLRLHYLDWGNSEAPPLLLVHGHRDHCHNWDWVAEALRDEYHIVAPDFRGHGDSAWVYGAAYSHGEYIYDLAQLIHQLELAPVTIIAHSLGGSVALRYAGIYPENIHKMIVIEGTGGPPVELENMPLHERLRQWIESTRSISGRTPKRYKTLEDAYQRMHEANSHLREDQARNLTIHGTNQNEDGTYSWKFDNYTHVMSPFGIDRSDSYELWKRIDKPVLLVSGKESWMSGAQKTEDPVRYFPNASHVQIEGAGHWLHHDQLDNFLEVARGFLS